MCAMGDCSRGDHKLVGFAGNFVYCILYTVESPKRLVIAISQCLHTSERQNHLVVVGEYLLYLCESLLAHSPKQKLLCAKFAKRAELANWCQLVIVCVKYSILWRPSWRAQFHWLTLYYARVNNITARRDLLSHLSDLSVVSFVYFASLRFAPRTTSHLRVLRRLQARRLVPRDSPAHLREDDCSIDREFERYRHRHRRRRRQRYFIVGRLFTFAEETSAAQVRQLSTRSLLSCVFPRDRIQSVRISGNFSTVSMSLEPHRPSQ